MNITILPTLKIRARINVPASKSLTHRAIIVAALTQGQSYINNLLKADDIESTIRICRSFGIQLHPRGVMLGVDGIDGKLVGPKSTIFIGESGTTARFAVALACLSHNETIIDGTIRMRQRPMDELISALRQCGATIDCLENDGFLPVQIRAGKLKGGKVSISGKTSSQFVSALLLIAPYMEDGLELHIINDLVSKPYVDITIDVMNDFGVSVLTTDTGYVVNSGNHYQSRNYTVEGDYSSASYFAAAAAITKGSITLKGLKKNSKQADRVFMDILERMGCNVVYQSSTVRVTNKSKLRGIEVDMSGCPDVVPTLAAVALYASSPTKITNIKHLQNKESDRIKTISSELTKMGGKVEYGEDYFIINPSNVSGGIVDSHSDHRIAMMCAVAALGAKGETTIISAETVSKSYPDFFDHLVSLNVRVRHA